MNSNQPRAGRASPIKGYIFAVLLAFVGPFSLTLAFSSLMQSAAFSTLGMPVIMLSSIGLIWLYNYAGRGPFVCGCVLQMLAFGLYFGGPCMWVYLLAVLMPTLSVLRNSLRDAPFGEQLRSAIIGHIFGLLAGVFLLYVNYGGNFITRILAIVEEEFTVVMQDMLARLQQSGQAVRLDPISPESFIAQIGEFFDIVVPVYNVQLPGLLFSGALLTAVISAGLANYLRHRGDEKTSEAYVPVYRWCLKASTTWGTLLMLLVAYMLLYSGMKRAEAVYYAVFEIALAIFCIQAYASFMRRLHASALRRGARRFVTILLWIIMLGSMRDYFAIYGIASAIFGSGGAIRQHRARHG